MIPDEFVDYENVEVDDEDNAWLKQTQLPGMDLHLSQADLFLHLAESNQCRIGVDSVFLSPPSSRDQGG